MTILIAYASKHGSTKEIAEHIAKKLRQMGKEAEARSVDTIESPESYEAVVLGSAIYYGSNRHQPNAWLRLGCSKS